MTNNIPFLDLVGIHRELEVELIEIFREALRTGRFIGGPNVQRFEEEFAEFCETKHCVGVGSGTDALRFALTAAGVKPGETVITVPNTFIATVEAISQVGAVPEFVDVDERTFNMAPEKLRVHLETKCTWNPDRNCLISHRTGQPITAIIPVHLYGQIADMDPILELAEKYNLLVIEDACQAHGAEYFSKRENRWMKAGSIGCAGAFSFYPGKNLGACGEGGAVTTNDPELAKAAAMIRDHGQSEKYIHLMEGYNGRLDAVQAGVLGIKLKRLNDWTAQRQRCARDYGELLREFEGVTVPYQPAWTRPVYHLYVILHEDRAALAEHLAGEGIYTGLHYPIPIHLQKAYSQLNHKEGDFPVTEWAANRLLSLPMFPALTISQQQRIARAIEEFVREGHPEQHLKEASVGN